MGPMGRRGRRRGLVVGAAVGASMANRGKNNDAESAQQAPAAQDDMTAQLEQLQNLKTQGIITQEEFDTKKKQILGI